MSHQEESKRKRKMTERTLPHRFDPQKHSELAEELSAEHSPSVGKSIAWLILFVLLFYGAALIFGAVYGFYVGVTDPQLVADVQTLEEAAIDAMLSPFGIAVTFVIQAILLIPVILWASNFSHQSWRETLAFRPVAWSVLGFWMLVYAAYLIVQSLVEWVAPTDLGDFIESLAGSKHLGLALGMILIAPVIEELIFRGYLFRAWRHTRMGLWGTLILTSLLFTGIHAAQYSGIILVYMFALSLLLGLARESTGSIWPPLAFHMVNNLIAVITLVYLGIT